MTLLVIGCGIGGHAAIAGFRKKDKTTKIVLVEPRDFGDVNWAAYRAPFDEITASRSLAPIKAFCQKNQVEHKATTVTKLTKDEAFLADGTTVVFDACVVATGAHMQWALTGRGTGEKSRASRLETLKTEGAKILKASSVLVVGGGLVGVEVAGDVKAHADKQGNKDIKVTLVHSGDRLCPEMAAAASAMVKRQLEKCGIKIVLNDKAVEKANGTYALQSSGEVVSAEIVIPTTGLKACNDFVDIEGSKIETGFLDTDDFFRVNNAGGKVFAIGDCCTTLPNAGSQVMQNSGAIGANLFATIQAVQKREALAELKLQKFSLGPPVKCVTTSLDTGVADLGCTYTQYMLPSFKQNTMFFFSPKQMLGMDTDGTTTTAEVIA